MLSEHVKTSPFLLLFPLLILLTCCSGPPENARPLAYPPEQTVASGDGDAQASAESGGAIASGDTAAISGGASVSGDTAAISGGGADAPPAHILMPDPVSVVSEEAENTPAFGSGIARGQIAMITFLSDPSKAPDSAWDVSEARDGSVLAWTLKTQPPYDLYIAAENGVAAPENCSGLFCGYSNLRRIRFEAPFDASRAVDMSAMFDSCVSLSELDVSGFDTSNVTDMESMFRRCAALESLDVSGFDTSRVTDMRSMFRACGKLKALDISRFQMGAVTDVRWMFADCVGLESLRLNSYDFPAAKLNEGYLKNVPMRFSATPLTGTPGFDPERDYPALFDGDLNTKWCMILRNVSYVEWKMACPGSVAHFSLTSADNCDKYPGRNPGAWRLLGTDAAKRRDGVWTVLGEMNPSGFEERDDENFVKHTTTFTGEAPAFQYYRLEITSTTGAEILQISEIDMDYR